MPIMNSMGALSYAKLGDSTVPNREFYCLKFKPAGINSASDSFAARQSIAFDPTDNTGNYAYYSATMLSNVSGITTSNMGLVPLLGSTNVVIGNKRTFLYSNAFYERGSNLYDSGYNSLNDFIYNVGTSFESPTSGSSNITGLGFLVTTNSDNSYSTMTTQLPKLGRSAASNQRPYLTWQNVLVEPYTGFPTGRIFIGGYDTVGSAGAYGIVPQLQFISDNGGFLNLTRWNDGAVTNKTSGDPEDHTMCMAYAPDGNVIVAYSNDTTATRGAVYIRKVSSTISGGILPTISSIGLQGSATDRLWLRDLAVDSSGNIYCVVKRYNGTTFFYHILKLDSSYNILYNFYTTNFVLNSVCVTTNDNIYVAGGGTIYDLTTGSFAIARTMGVGATLRGTTRLFADNLDNVYLTTRYLGSLPSYPSYQDFGVILKFQTFSDLKNSTFSDGSSLTFISPPSSWTTGTFSSFALTAAGTSETPNTYQLVSGLVDDNASASTTAFMV